MNFTFIDVFIILLMAKIFDHISQYKWGNRIANLMSIIGLLFWFTERYSNIATG